ncbi:MAG: cation-efflux pump [candidate division Zixibacteria bacterium]|nr:cation-efflux pump [candidate division Zixibacteria bacterium]
MTQVEKKENNEKVRVAFSSFLAAIFLTLTKLVVGIITQSLGIISEAAHSGLDLVAAGMTYFTVKRSDKPADAEHQFGHGKFENLSALLEAILLLITCIWIIFESFKRLFFKSVEVKVVPISFIVMVFAIVVDYSRSKALYRMAKKHQSQALEADALHFSSDIFSSLVVIAGLIFVKIGIPMADPLAALGVAIVVLYASWRLGKRTIDVLLDRAPEGLDLKIREKVRSVSRVSSISRLRLRKAGSHYFLDMNVMLKKDSSLEEAHQVTTRIEEKINEILPNSDVVVHAEPEEGEGFLEEKSELYKEEPEEKKIISEILNQHFDEFVEFHNLTFSRAKDKRLINLHIVVPKDIKIEDAHSLCDHLEGHIKERLGNSEISIHIEPCEGECETCNQICENKKITGDSNDY